MFCLQCHSKKLQVTNSRHQTKHTQIWRRRKCQSCGYIFTTYEAIATDKLHVILANGQVIPFIDIRLILSIAKCFEHTPNKRAEHAKWLADTITHTLMKTGHGSFEKELLITTTYQTLKNFDHLASVQYAARHADTLKRYLR